MSLIVEPDPQTGRLTVPETGIYRIEGGRLIKLRDTPSSAPDGYEIEATLDLDRFRDGDLVADGGRTICTTTATPVTVPAPTFVIDWDV